MMDWRTAKILAIDTETTGVDSAKDRIVELAGVECSGQSVLNRRGTLVNPSMAIPAESTAIHGITDAMVGGKPTLAEVAPKFLPRVEAAEVIVGYNVRFDIGFLSEQCPGFAEAIDGKPILDACPLSKRLAKREGWRLGGGAQKLTAMAERFGIQPRGSAHRATTDAIMAVDVLFAVAPLLPLDRDAWRAHWQVAEIQDEEDRLFQEWLDRKNGGA